MTRPPERGAASVERECLRAAGVVALGGAAAALLLWAATFPGWPLAAGVMLSVLVFAGLLIVLGAEPVPAARRLRPIGLVIALVVAVGGAILIENSGDAALRARFQASRADFEAVVADQGPPTHRGSRADVTGSCPTSIGSFAVEKCQVVDGGYLFLQQRAALGDDAGFAYLPAGAPTSAAAAVSGSLPPDQLSHLGGPWYAWSCGC